MSPKKTTIGSNQPLFSQFGRKAVTDLKEGTNKMARGEQGVLVALYYAHVEGAMAEINADSEVHIDISQMYLGDLGEKAKYSERFWNIVAEVFGVATWNAESEKKNKWELVGIDRAAFDTLRQKIRRCFPTVKYLIDNREDGKDPFAISGNGNLQVPFGLFLTDDRWQAVSEKEDLEYTERSKLVRVGASLYGVYCSMEQLHRAAKVSLGLAGGMGGSGQPQNLTAKSIKAPAKMLGTFFSGKDEKVLKELGKETKLDLLRMAYEVLRTFAPSDTEPTIDHPTLAIDWERAREVIDEAFLEDEHEVGNGEDDEETETSQAA